MKTYYHITNTKNKDSIIKEGLKASDGEIFIFDHLPQAEYIALQQIGLSEYSLFKINAKGFEVELKIDNVGEQGALTQFIVQQPLIKSEYVKYVKDVSFDHYKEAAKQNFIRNTNLARLDGYNPVEAKAHVIMQMRGSHFDLAYINKKYNLNLRLLSVDEMNTYYKTGVHID